MGLQGLVVLERLLVAGADPHQPDAEGVTPLQLAQQEGQWGLVEMMQAPVSSRGWVMAYGWTPLHQAAQRGDRDQVAKLLAQGHDPHARTYYGATALHEAALGQDAVIVESLLQVGGGSQCGHP